MSKNVLMLVGGLALIVVIIFWVQSVLVKSLQHSATLPIDTPPAAQTSTTSTSTTTQGSQPAAQAPAVKKTTITKPVHKH